MNTKLYKFFRKRRRDRLSALRTRVTLVKNINFSNMQNSRFIRHGSHHSGNLVKANKKGFALLALMGLLAMLVGTSPKYY